MCGFAGLYSPFKQNMVTEESVMEMIAPIYRRGPDDFGTWCDPQKGIGLGHCRLSIIDTSHAGHQTMKSHDERYQIALLVKYLLIHALNMIGDAKSKGSMLGDKVHKALTLLDHKEFMNFYRDLLMSSYRDVGSIVIGEDDGFSQLSISDSECDYDSLNELMSTVDMTTYLPDDILCKVDRCAMGHSLEGRIPLLDHRIIEFALRLPSSYKTRDKAKWLLRQVLFKHVPPALIERPKKGFSVPLDVWLRGPLKEWAESLLSSDKIEKQGFLNAVTLKRLWREHQSGVRNWSAVLWNILMFQQWLESRASD